MNFATRLFAIYNYIRQKLERMHAFFAPRFLNKEDASLLLPFTTPIMFLHTLLLPQPVRMMST